MIFENDGSEFELPAQGVFYEYPQKLIKYPIKNKTKKSIFHIWEEDGKWESSDNSLNEELIQKLGVAVRKHINK